MMDRVDKYGHPLRLGDVVRLPSANEGFIQGFTARFGRERVLVRYRQTGVGEVVLLPELVERLGCLCTCYKGKASGRNATMRPFNRVPSGESHYRARLTDEEVREMRKLHRRAGKGYCVLAAIFGCGVSTARDICTHRTRRNAG